MGGLTMQRIQIVDSHTGGEPTRVVVAGGPDLGGGSLTEQCQRFRADHDAFRRAVVCEPRGSDFVVGALLTTTPEPDCATGVIFFNNIGFLGMCGHGTIGVAVTLGHLGRISAGKYVFDTPVGRVPIEYDGANTVTLENVPSYRHRKDVTVEIGGLGTVSGDVAWGGNWFFLVRQILSPIDLAHLGSLMSITTRIREALREHGITGADGAEIDHIELFDRSLDAQNSSRNFVLCPGGAYDRSPCGTGTSAKIACLAADGLLKPGENWRQESILGSVFTASYRRDGEKTIPRITGQAFVTAESTLLIDDADPLGWGWSL
jgi:4-hydroxyproline epimerase